VLHFVREIVCGWVHSSNRHIQRTIPNEHQSPASTSPAIDHSSTQDRCQPCSLAAPTRKAFAALPRTAQSFLHDILGIMRITHQPVCNAVQCRGVFVDQDDKVCPRKRHPLPLSLPVPLRKEFRALFGRLAGAFQQPLAAAFSRDAFYHIPAIAIRFALEIAVYSRERGKISNDPLLLPQVHAPTSIRYAALIQLQ
jgi:hypothetical protein